MSKPFTITVAGNTDACRTEAELYVGASESFAAIVYESRVGWVVDLFEMSGVPLAVLMEGIQQAKQKLGAYVNRRGENPPSGLSGPGLSLWLMERDDGTAMGRPIG